MLRILVNYSIQRPELAVTLKSAAMTAKEEHKNLERKRVEKTYKQRYRISLHEIVLGIN